MSVELKKKSRFDNICSYRNTIVLSTNNNYKSNIVDKNRHRFKKIDCKLIMFIKRYFHKLYVSKKRLKNEKVDFSTNMYLLECYSNFNKTVAYKIIRNLGLEIKGVIVDNNYYVSNYNIILKSNFNQNNMLIIILLAILKMFSILVILKKIKNM